MTVLHVAAGLPISIRDMSPVFHILGCDHKKSKLDPNHLSREGAPALYYAVKRLDIENIEHLVPVTNPLCGSADKHPLTVLSNEILDLCQDSKKLFGLLTAEIVCGTINHYKLKSVANYH